MYVLPVSVCNSTLWKSVKPVTLLYLSANGPQLYPELTGTYSSRQFFQSQPGLIQVIPRRTLKLKPSIREHNIGALVDQDAGPGVSAYVEIPDRFRAAA